MTVRIEFNHQGFADLVAGRGADNHIKDYLLQLAEQMASAAGPGYEAEDASGPLRARARVYTATVEAMIDNEQNDTLIAVLEAGR